MNPGNTQILNPDGRLQPGCYYARFRPIAPYWRETDNPEDRARGIREYEGTLRVVHYNNRGNRAYTVKELEDGARGQVMLISGDLYASSPDSPQQIPENIPIFRRDDYRFYLLATGLNRRGPNEFDLCLRSYELLNGEWKPEEIVAHLTWSGSDHLTGPVLDRAGNETGEISLTWISFYLRRAMLEFDRVDHVRLPMDNFTGVEDELLQDVKRCTWGSVFESCGWRIETKESDQPAEPPSKMWSDTELHAALPALRDTFDLDQQWRYHIFCVGKLEDAGRGYKFDVNGGEPGSPLFPSVVLAGKYEFGDERIWGKSLGRKALDLTPAYFRTAVHELGHALGLEHNFNTTGFMSTTDTLRDVAAQEALAPDQIDVLKAMEWEFAPDDLQRLRHWPDAVIRPGSGAVPKFALPGIDEYRITVLEGGAVDAPGKVPLELEIKPFEGEVPVGAPVRILLKLTNKDSKARAVPRLSFKSGNITGSVELPSGETRRFAPVAETLDDRAEQILAPEKSIEGSLTLLRGPDGALFPDSGSYNITIDLWIFHRNEFATLSKSTAVRVGPFRDEKHRRIAELLARTKETLVSFAIGSGDGLEGGNQAVNLALNNAVLKTHFAVIRLKRLCRGIGRVRGSLDEALRLLAEESRLTDSEMAGLIGMVLPSRRLRAGQERQDAEAVESTLVNNYLKADLRYVGTRIILGNLDRDPFEAFVRFIWAHFHSSSTKSAIQQLGTAEIIRMFRGFLETEVGLNETESKELVELLLVRDTRLADAIQAFAANPGDEKNRADLRRAAMSLGLSEPGLKRIVQRLREVVAFAPGLLGENDLVRASELILESFDATADGQLHALFVQNLKRCLRGAILSSYPVGQPPAAGPDGFGALATVKDILLLKQFLEEKVGLTVIESREFVELLFQRDTKLAQAVGAYLANPNAGQQVREAARNLGLSDEPVARVLEWLGEAWESDLDKLEPDEVIEARDLIRQCLSSAKTPQSRNGGTEEPAVSGESAFGERATIESAAVGFMPKLWDWWRRRTGTAPTPPPSNESDRHDRVITSDE
jgi:hypothetical protein